MTNDNTSEQLSDKDLSYDVSNLSEACSNWNKAVMSADLGSIDVSGSFSALTQNGIGVGYIASLQTALQQSDKLALNISSLISATAQEQADVDNSSADESDNLSYNTYAGTSSGGGGGGGIVPSSGSVDTGSYASDNTDKDTEIKEDADTKTAELTNDDYVSIVKEFQNIFNGELYDYLFSTDSATKIKEKLLSSPNLSTDLKQKISEMDENEIQTNLKSIYVSGAMVSDFSKIIVTIFDNDLKNNFNSATIFDSSKSIADVYSFLSKQTDFQEQLKEIYFGSTSIEKVDNNVIYLTRNFVDTVATASNVSYEDILSNSKYQDALLSEIKDLANTFSVIEGAKALGNETKSTLYSNIIIKEEG